MTTLRLSSPVGLIFAQHRVARLVRCRGAVPRRASQRKRWVTAVVALVVVIVGGLI